MRAVMDYTDDRCGNRSHKNVEHFKAKQHWFVLTMKQ